MKTIDLRDCESTVAVNRSRNLIEVTTLTEPDPNWSFTDAAGHVHRWSKDSRLPTLKYVVDEWAYDEDGERYAAITHHECKKCREHVTPGIREGTPKHIAGLQRVEINASVPIDQFDDLLAIIQSGEKCTVLLPNDLPNVQAYLTSVQQTVDGLVEIQLRGA